MSAIIIAKVAALLDRRLAVRILSVPLDKFVIVDRLKSQYLVDLFTNISLMSAFACKAAIKSVWNYDIEGPLSAH